ncbi:sodium/hydrogen exchanger 1-like [Gigantopelta aegis]|uniref:sodium/hydrogen exchanger 1-like n=1 Tax=Gigantopelta aegis TaxID=1735272 RepID=UPI001B888717|nr:sodium/hydrogen exchanger 1-like [Gigantopelta aegis]
MVVTLQSIIAIFSIYVFDVIRPCGSAPTNYSTTTPTPTPDVANNKSDEGIQVAGLDFETVKSPLVYTVVVLLAGLSKIIYHYANFLSAKVPESCMLIILGTIFGAIIHFSGAAEHLPLFFAPHAFFLFLLPPIILEAAYSLHDPTFAENIGSVLLFAVVGTVLACFMLGLTLYGLAISGAMGVLPMPMSLVQILVFSSLIVAVDPVAVLAVFSEVGVNHVLYFLLFGESLLNAYTHQKHPSPSRFGKAIALNVQLTHHFIILTITSNHSIEIVLGVVKFVIVCLGGFILGVLAGAGTAILTRFTSKVKVLQPLVIYTMAYLGFLLAELFEFSGIISLISCGLTQVHYAFHNISDHSRTTVKYFTRTMSSACEIVIFMFLGLALVREDHVWHTGFVLWTVLFCLLYRFIIVFGMTFLINKLDGDRVRKIGLDEQFMISYGGLRGAVCFSLVALLNEDEIPMKSMFVTTTLFVIMFTVFIQGITIKPFVRCFQVQLAPEKHFSMSNELNSHVIDHLMAGIEDIIGFHGRYHFKELLEQFEEKHVLHWLQKDPQRRDTEIKAFYEKVILKEHYRYLKLSGVKALPSSSNIPHIATEMYLTDMDKTQTEEIPTEEPSSESSDHIVVIEPMRLRANTMDPKNLRSLFSSQLANRLFLHNVYNRSLVIADPQEHLSNRIQAKAKRNHYLERTISEEDRNGHRRPRSASEPKVSRKNPKKRNRTVTIDLGESSRHNSYFTPRSDLDSPGTDSLPEYNVPPSTPEASTGGTNVCFCMDEDDDDDDDDDGRDLVGEFSRHGELTRQPFVEQIPQELDEDTKLESNFDDTRL